MDVRTGEREAQQENSVSDGEDARVVGDSIVWWEPDRVRRA
jgi:hypothetical protein